jgi:hypothetical protein
VVAVCGTGLLVASLMTGCASKGFEDAIQGSWTCTGSLNGESRQVTLKFDGTTFEKTLPQGDGSDALATGSFQVTGESSDGTGGTISYLGEWEETGFDYTPQETFTIEGDALEGDCTYAREIGSAPTEEGVSEAQGFEDAIQGSWTCTGSLNGESRQVTLKFDGTTFEKTLPQGDGSDALATGSFQVTGESSDGTGGTISYLGEWEETGFDYTPQETFTLEGDALEGDCTYTRGSTPVPGEESVSETIPEEELVGSGDTSDGSETSPSSGSGLKSTFTETVQGAWEANTDSTRADGDIEFSAESLSTNGRRISFEVQEETLVGSEIRATILLSFNGETDTMGFSTDGVCLWKRNAAYEDSWEKASADYWARPGGNASQCEPNR